jgi:membrane protease YdiL (CAAX protease family)
LSPPTAFLKRHSLVIGILLMFLFTWPIDLSNSGVLPFHVPFLLYLFLGWGIVLASLLMTGLTLGRQGILALLRRFLLWRVGWKWYLAMLIMPSLDIIGITVFAALTRTSPDFSTVFARKIFGASANLALLALPFLIEDAISNGEEIGWRGYVLPRLQAKHSALTSALVVGLIWGLWHLPRYFTHWDGVSFAWFMLDVLAKSIFLAWVYNGTRGSLLLTTLCHAAWNTAGVFLPVANTLSNSNQGAFILIVLLQVVLVAVITVATGPADLSSAQPKQVQV